MWVGREGGRQGRRKGRNDRILNSGKFSPEVKFCLVQLFQVAGQTVVNQKFSLDTYNLLNKLYA